MQRYAFELLSAIDKLLSSNQIEPAAVSVLVPPDVRELPPWQSLRIQNVGRFTGQLWEQLDLAIHAKETLLFTPCGGAPVLHDRHVITIHDAGPFVTPGAYTAAYRTYYKLLQRILSRKASHILTISQFSKDELVRVLGLPESKLSYAWLSGEHILRVKGDESVITRNGLIKGEYVLAVGSRNPNKNLDGLIAAMPFLQDMGVTLVIAGGSNSKIFGDSGRTDQKIKELGFVNDGELRSLYENAACFAFPSFYEGFGFPPLEAMTLGTPVVVSRAASLPEVFGDVALYCDPHSPRDIANSIRDALQGKAPSGDTARSYAARFTWENCARETWDILVKLMLFNSPRAQGRLT